MKKFLLILSFVAFNLFSSTFSSAEDQQTITLKDGTRIVGKLISVKDNVYTIEAPSLGKIYLPSSQIVTITSDQANPLSQQTTSTNPSAAQPVDSAQLKEKVQQMQTQLFSDEQFMKGIQDLINDEEVKKILMDPTLMKAVLSYDPSTIEKNEKVKELLQNPKIQELINRIQQKYAPSR